MAKAYTKKDYEAAGSPADLVIPEGFTEIGPQTFKDVRESLKSVAIPSTVKEITEKLLYGCVALESVIISRGVTAIGKEAFYGCRSLTNIVIPEGVASIGQDAFYGCRSLTNIVIPEGVTELERSAFRACTSLHEVSLPSTLSEINYDTFMECSGLQHVVIPKEIARIGNSAFSQCSSLESVELQGVKEIEYNAFRLCTSLKSVAMHDGTEIIKMDAFEWCNSLQSITLPESVKNIGKCAFVDCSSLQTINIPESVTEIGDNAFRGCNLGRIELDTSRFTLKDGLLIDKANHKLLSSADARLTAVSIPAGVTEMAPSVFSGLNSLKAVSIPEGVTAISDHAFSDCTSLQSVTIAEGVTEIGICAFTDCISLHGITIPESVKEIGYRAFSGCSSLQNIAIPAGITVIEGYFSNCSSLQSISLPASVTKIGSDAFKCCFSLRNIDFPDNIETIEYGAFSSCKSLTSVMLPESMKKVEENAFFNCEAITDVTILSSETVIDTKAFNGCKAITNVSLPKGLTWSKIKNRFAQSPWGQNKPLSAKGAAAKAKKEKLEALSSVCCSALLKSALDELLATESNVQADSENKNISATKVIIPGLVLRFTLPLPSDVAAMQQAIDGLVGKIKPVCDFCTNSLVSCEDGSNFVKLDPVTSKIEVGIDNAITKAGNKIRLKINSTDLESIGAALPGLTDDITKIDSLQELKGEYILRPVGSENRISLKRAVSYAPHLKVPDFINELESSSFSGAASLQSVSIPKNTSILFWPFDDCPMLTDIHLY